MRQRILQLLPKTALVSSAVIAGASLLTKSASESSKDCPYTLGAVEANNLVGSPAEQGVLGSLSNTVGWGIGKNVTAQLPTDKLSCKRACRQHAKFYRPTVLLSCGSFNPPTVAHLRMFELAADELSKADFDVLGGYMSPDTGAYHKNAGCDVLGGYMSPVNDAYHKTGLAPSQHRVAMCKLASETSGMVMVDSWEAEQPTYQRSLMALQRVEEALNDQLSGLSNSAPSSSTKQCEGRAKIRPMLLCGADMVESLAIPGVWKPEHVRTILGHYGVVCISREHSSVTKLLDDPESPLHEFRDNIVLVEDPIINNISATIVRQEIAQGRSIRYLVPDDVINYIQKQGLYR